MDQVFRHIHMPAELACEFLAVFSRLEYALKAAGFVNGGTGGVNANWDQFANEANALFEAAIAPDILSAAAYLFSRPPKKQVLDGQHLRFSDLAIDPKQRGLQQVLLMVRIIRNNLFHGGKHLPNGEEEPGRNEALVRSSLEILKFCAGLLDRVKERYEH